MGERTVVEFVTVRRAFGYSVSKIEFLSAANAHICLGVKKWYTSWRERACVTSTATEVAYEPFPCVGRY